jgi:NDP-sugar pyrophosphorylase family protein
MKDDFYCIIPCGGFGTRIKPFSKYIPKDLLPINGVPIICKVVEEIISIKKIKKIIFVTAPHKRIVTKVLNRYFPNDNYKFKFIIDNSYKGLDNSILLAKKYCRNAYGTLFY